MGHFFILLLLLPALRWARYKVMGPRQADQSTFYPSSLTPCVNIEYITIVIMTNLLPSRFQFQSDIRKTND